MEVPEESKLMGSPRSTPGNCRPRLLHSFGASLFTVARKIYRKAAESDNPIGSLARTLTFMASPILYPVEHQWLSILSFIDDRILAIEDVAMAVFPPSTHVFNKIDELALLAESLPGKTDDMMERLLVLIHQLPLLNWVSTKAISVLGTFFSERRNSSDERNILVDIECDEPPKVMTTLEESDEEIERRERSAEHLHDKEWSAQSMEDDIREVEDTCKEIIGALEKMGMVEKKVDKKMVMVEEELTVKPVASTKHEMLVQPESGEKKVHMRDPIMELFDDGWQGS